jgi:hypothetical protein
MQGHRRMPGRRERRRPPSDQAVRALSGALRFVDGGGRWATLAAPDGTIVTLDLADARFAVADRNGDGVLSAHDLESGDLVRVTAQVPRASRTLPRSLRVRRLSATRPVAAT